MTIHASRKRTHRRDAASLGALLTTSLTIACASTPTPTPQPGSLPRGYVAATRASADCATERARTATWSFADTVGLQRPLAKLIVIAPVPFPPDFQQARFDLRVAEDAM